MQRALDAAEFAQIKTAVIDKVREQNPDLTAEEFQRVYKPLLAEAVGRAESLPKDHASLETADSPVARLIAGWAGMLNPWPMAKQVGLDLQREVGAQAGRIQQASDLVRHGRYGEAVTTAVPLVGGPIAPALNIAGQYIKGMGQAQVNELQAAAASAREGNYGEAASHGAAGAIPILGPTAGGIRDRLAATGDVAGAIGQTAAIVTPLGLPKRAGMTGLFRNPDPLGVANTVWAIQRNLPIELAGATGNEYVKAVQAAGRGSLLGSGPTRLMDMIQTRKLLGYGQALAGRTGEKKPVSALQVGEGTLEDVTKLRDTIKAGAKEKYSEADMLAALADPEWVPTAENITPGMMARAEHSLGRALSIEEIQGLRRILAEMEENPFRTRTWVEGKLTRGGGAGADVYNDVKANMPLKKYRDPETGRDIFVNPDPERSDVIASLKRAIATGHFTDPAKGAVKVVEERLANPTGEVARHAELPPEAGILAPKMMQVPVDVGDIMDALRPEYDIQKQILSVTNKTADPGFTALAGFMEGPRVRPFDVLDKQLSAFKTIGRGGEMVVDAAALKTPSQRLAFKAIEAIEPVLKAKAETVPGLHEALTEARGQYAQMFPVEETRQTLAGKGPVTRFAEMVKPDDAGLPLLRQVQEYAPQQISRVARAMLDDVMAQAFKQRGAAGGGAAGAAKRWGALGEETKHILVPDAAHRHDITQFLELLAKRQENVNPSGSAFMALKVGELGGLFYRPQASTAAFSGLMGGLGIATMSPRVVRLLVEGFSIPARHVAAATVWQKELAREIEAAQKQVDQEQPAVP